VVGKEVPTSTEVLTPPEEPEDTPQSFVRHSAVMSVGTALSRITGFLRLAAMAYALGVAESRLADAYNVANTTPNIVYDLALGGIISSVFIPVFVERLESRNRDEAWHTARTVLTAATIGLTAIAVLGIAFSSLIIRAYTFRVQGPQAEAMRKLASFFLKWFLPQIVFYGLGAGVWTALLNAHRRFAAPMYAPIVNNVIATATFFAFAALPGGTQPGAITTLQRYVLAAGTTLGVIGMTVVLWPAVRRLGFRWRWTLDFKDRAFRKIVRLSGWAFVYVIVNQAGLLVVIVLAASVQGGYTAYQAAFIFFQLPYAIFAVSIMTALLPSLSARWSEQDADAFRQQLALGIRGTAFIVIPAAFGYIALSRPIVRLLLEHGVTQAKSGDLLAGILRMFSIGMFSFCLFQLLLRAYYGMQDTRTPALINVFAVGLNTAVNLIYFRYLKVEGLALGHATAYTFAAVTAAVMLRRRLGGLEGRRLAVPMAQILLGGVATGGAALLASHLSARTLGTASFGPQVLQVGAGVVAGMAAFIAVALAFRMEELRLIANLVRGRLSR
jgi:putative peptidoglycan lipid II flippase